MFTRHRHPSETPVILSAACPFAKQTATSEGPMHSHPHFYYVYIMTNRSKTIYTGVTGYLEKRVFEHKQGIKGEFARRYNIDRLVYFERFWRGSRRHRPRETNQGPAADKEDRLNRIDESRLEEPFTSTRLGRGLSPPPSCRTCSAHNRHRGSGHPLTPATPPYMRVRIRRFSAVELDDIEQLGKAERVEGSNGKS
jgi:hypothetical protein